MSAGSLVAELIERSGLTKAELAKRSGISRSSVDEYLLGKRQPSVAQLARLGEAAGFRLDLAWAPVELRVAHDPSWLIPNNPDMADRPTTRQQRAQILARVVAVATELRRRDLGALEFPPFRQLVSA